MPLPTSLSALSYGDSSIPSYLTATLASSYTTGQTFTLDSTASWLEVGSTGAATANPLGTTGPFVVAVDFGLSTEEHILCSSVNVASGALTVWTDGTYNGRGYGTPISAHAIGSSSATNCFPMQSSVFDLQNRTQIIATQTAVVTAQSTANTAVTDAATAQSTANAAGTLAASATVTADAALPKTGGTVTGATTFSAEVTILDGVNPQDPAAFHQIPTALPPSGAAGGSLAGTYPDPTIESSVALPGSPTTTTQAPGDDTTKVATTAFVTAADAVVLGAAETYADRYAGSAQGTASRPLAATDASTTNARTPTAHAATHASAGSDPVTLAESQVTGLTTDLAAKAPLASPALTGTPTAPTPSALDNSTKVSTTAYTDAAVGVETTRAETAEALAAQKSANLSDLANEATARTNLGLGTAATHASSDFDAAGAASTAQANAESFTTTALGSYPLTASLSKVAQTANRAKLYTADYGIVGGDNTTNYGDLLNQLFMLAEKMGALIEITAGQETGLVPSTSQIFSSQTIVMRKNTGLVGCGTGGGISGIRLLPNANCNVMDKQYYNAAAAAFNPSSHAYYAGGVCTYNGNYYGCLVGYTSSATTPDADIYHWEVISPVFSGTVASSTVVTLNTTTPVSLPVTSITDVQGRSCFGQWGGVMSITVSAVTYTLTYTGISGSSLTGCLITSGSVTTAGGEAIFPAAAINNSGLNYCLHGNWASGNSPGSFHHGFNYSNNGSQTLDLFINVQAGSCTGDGFHDSVVSGPGCNYIGCVSSSNNGSGLMTTVDSKFSAGEIAYNGLGGVLNAHSDYQFDGKSYNNGGQPIWMTATTGLTATAASGSTITLNAPITVDAIGQGIYDGASPGAGNIPAGTKILAVTGTGTTVLLSKAITGALSATAVTYGGYYFWPTATGPTQTTGCVNTVDGIFYVLKVASAYGLSTTPDGDTTNWQPVRTAYEWGWGLYVHGALGEWSSFHGNVQANKRGAFACDAGPAINIDLTAQEWLSNPWTGSGALIGVPSTPTNLLVPACVNVSGASQIIGKMNATLAGAPAPIGTLLVVNSSTTKCDLVIGGDTNYLTAMSGTPGAGCRVVLNGTTIWGDPLPLVTYPANQYFPPIGSWATGVASVASTAYVTPLVVRQTHTFTRISVQMTAAATGGGSPILRMGIWKDNGSCYPGTLVAECGTIACGSGTTLEITISQQLTPGLYWIGFVPQSIVTTPPTFRAASGATPGVTDVLGSSAALGGNLQTGYSVAGVSGALGTFPSGGTILASASCPSTQLRS